MAAFGWLGTFWRQRCAHYRDFQIAYTLLALNFILPAASYALAPEIASTQFGAINAALGGAAYGFPEDQSRLWRYLGAANVMTLGLMCVLLQINLRRYRPVLVPLVFLKAYNATLFLCGYLAAPGYRMLLAVALFDFATSFAFVFFARRATHAIEGVPDEDLVPRPRV